LQAFPGFFNLRGISDINGLPFAEIWVSKPFSEFSFGATPIIKALR
jgi:hypothetical protein